MTRISTIEEALDRAKAMLAERFDEVDQEAVVELAQVLYAMRERERFDSQHEKDEDIPYNL